MVSLEDLIGILSLLVATVAVVISMVNLIINIKKRNNRPDALNQAVISN